MKQKIIYIKMIRFVALMTLFLVQLKGFAQNKIIMTSRVQTNSIMLRWAPTSAVAWKNANKYGYILERTTVTRDGAILLQPDTKRLTDTIRPQPFNRWQPLIDSSNYAAVIAQAIYSDSFQVNIGNKVDKNSKVTVRSKEAQLRFSLSLFSADHDFVAAQYAGLGYIDNDVKPGEKYLYKIYTLIPSQILKIDTGGVYIGLDEFEPLAANNTIKSNFGDHMVMLNWDYDRYRKMYNSYKVEKSEDSTHFEPVNKLPFVDLSKGSQKSTHSYFTDSIKENGKFFYYRIRGINSFGEVGPPSIVVKGIGLGSLKESPFITGTDILTDSAVYLEWTFSNELLPAVRRYELLMSQTYKGKYISILQNIPPSATSLVYKNKTKLEGAYYFKLRAVGAPGTKPSESFPAFVQTIDSVPPVTPKAPKAVVNDKGIIKVKWSKSKEKDLYGYKLFRATHAYEEYSAVFSTILRDTNYIDTVQMNMLNDTIYYKLIAIDHRGNNSEFGAIGFAVKPDIIPPAPAYFNKYEMVTEGIELNWDRSPSRDVKEYILKRKEGSDTLAMKVIKKWSPKDSVVYYIDEKLKHDQVYTYQLDVVDKAGLKSSNRPMTIKYYRLSEMVKPAVKGLDTYYDEKLNIAYLFWSYREKDVEEFRIYRGRAGEPMTMWQVVDANVFKVEDKNIVRDKEYIYGVIVRFKNGTQSKLSKITKTY
ncbi:MAG: hypothetical protein HYZ42_10910 [Bacteroidetes bacterium]|nr:hypothetical protein [Bacteroidota bacterium]